jgi:hypothetical protein
MLRNVTPAFAIELGDYSAHDAYRDARAAASALAVLQAVVASADQLASDSKPISTYDVAGALDGARAQVERVLNLLVDVCDATDQAEAERRVAALG